MKWQQINNRVIILNRERACLAREREESDAILPHRSVQRHSVTSLETARSLANDPSAGGRGGSEGEVWIPCSPRICGVSYLSFVYGRSLWGGGENYLHWKVNICSLYLVLWLCDHATLAWQILRCDWIIGLWGFWLVEIEILAGFIDQKRC